MSPSAALESDVFLTYVAIVGVMLAAAGATIGLLRYTSNRDMAHAWSAYRGWLIMAPLVLLSIFLGRAATIVFLTTVGLFGCKEFARATGLYRDWSMMGLVYAAILAAGTTALVTDPNTAEQGWYGLYMALPVYAISAFLLVPILRNQCSGQLQTVSLAILAFLYIGWMYGHLAFLANSRHAYGYLLYLLFAVELNDVAAYTFGKLFGRHRERWGPSAFPCCCRGCCEFLSRILQPANCC
jgi:phosphatidate cytidylyltransferase